MIWFARKLLSNRTAIGQGHATKCIWPPYFMWHWIQQYLFKDVVCKNTRNFLWLRTTSIYIREYQRAEVQLGNRPGRPRRDTMSKTLCDISDVLARTSCPICGFWARPSKMGPDVLAQMSEIRFSVQTSQTYISNCTSAPS